MLFKRSQQMVFGGCHFSWLTHGRAMTIAHPVGGNTVGGKRGIQLHFLTHEANNKSSICEPYSSSLALTFIMAQRFATAISDYPCPHPSLGVPLLSEPKAYAPVANTANTHRALRHQPKKKRQQWLHIVLCLKNSVRFLYYILLLHPN